jgi:hypothetical protein
VYWASDPVGSGETLILSGDDLAEGEAIRIEEFADDPSSNSFRELMSVAPSAT